MNPPNYHLDTHEKQLQPLKTLAPDPEFAKKGIWRVRVEPHLESDERDVTGLLTSRSYDSVTWAEAPSTLRGILFSSYVTHMNESCHTYK